MISALYRYPKAMRRNVASAWGKRSAGVRAEQRIALGPDADTLRWRALHDARGTVVREGCTYRANGSVVRWQVRRAVAGRVDQFEFVANGRVKLCAGPRRFPQEFRP